MTGLIILVTLLRRDFTATFCGAINRRCSLIAKSNVQLDHVPIGYGRCKQLNVTWMD